MEQLEVEDPLYRVGDGVAEVQDLPESALTAVCGDDVGLDPHTAGDQGGDRGGKVGGRGAVVADGAGKVEDGVKVGCVGDDAVLDHLGEPAAQHVVRKRGQQLRVDDDGRRVMKRADEVLANGRIDGGFAADRGVNHGEQRGRHLHDGETAHEGGGHESGQVADDATPHGDDGGIASGAPFQQGVGEFGPAVARFLLLTRRDGEQACAIGRELGRNRFSVQARDGAVADDGYAMRRGRTLRNLPDALPHPGPAVDRVRQRQRQRVGMRARHYQVTSPAPARLLATRASMNRRSDRRLR